MESLGEAVDALVRTTKIAIDHHLEKVETKITDTVERKTENFDTKIRQIESEIELHKTAQMLSNKLAACLEAFCFHRSAGDPAGCCAAGFGGGAVRIPQ